jgi:hypothetical protein
MPQLMEFGFLFSGLIGVPPRSAVVDHCPSAASLCCGGRYFQGGFRFPFLRCRAVYLYAHRSIVEFISHEVRYISGFGCHCVRRVESSRFDDGDIWCDDCFGNVNRRVFQSKQGTNFSCDPVTRQVTTIKTTCKIFPLV